MPTVHTNVLDRYIVQDDPSQLAAANGFIGGRVVERSTLIVSLTVVLELNWVLRSRFAFGKDDALMTLGRPSSAAELTFESERALEVGLQLFRKGSAGFADCLNVALAKQTGAQPL